jgi:hypothetical protein
MAYSIIWDVKSVCIDYFGEVDNKNIKSAHYEVNNDERFYDCSHLILDITKCDMSKVDVSELIEVAGLDLGSLIVRKSFKIAMIAIEPDKLEIAHSYIDFFNNYAYKINVFNSIDSANSWLNRI